MRFTIWQTPRGPKAFDVSYYEIVAGGVEAEGTRGSWEKVSVNGK
jgi:hypothetical protein